MTFYVNRFRFALELRPALYVFRSISKDSALFCDENEDVQKAVRIPGGYIA